MPSIATDRLTGISTSRAFKAPCVAVATTALTMSGEQTVNGVACVTGDRVLRAVPGAQVDNGIWVVDTGQWSRAKDFDGSRDVTRGTLVLVAPGTPNALVYCVTTSGLISPGTTAIEIEEFSGDAISLRSDLASAASAAVGAGMVLYDSDNPYALGTVGAKLRERISVKDPQFGAVGDGVADDTAALAAARAFVAANAERVRLVFPAGIYNYSVSPNWAIANAVIVPEGEVRLRYTGTGDAVILDSGASPALTFNVTFGLPDCRFFIEAPATSSDGIYLRSVHHSKICANVRGCGAAALRTEFSVCSEFWITVSVNQAAWYSSPGPPIGLYLDQRDVGEQTSACQFWGPIIEGVKGDGIRLVSAVMCQFWGNTSEGNEGYGVNITGTLNRYNSFYGLDMEVNDLGDVNDAGINNRWIGCLSDSTFSQGASGLNTVIEGGQYNAIAHLGTGLHLNRLDYGSAGGTISGSGTLLSKQSVRQNSGGAYDEERDPYSLHGSASIATATPTTLVTLPSTGTRNYIVTACSPGAGNAAAYSAWAMIAQDLTTSRILTQVDGSNLTITKSGQNIVVTQTSGGSITVECRANPA